MKVTRMIKFPAPAFGVVTRAFNGTRTLPGTIQVLNTATYQIVKSIPVGNNPGPTLQVLNTIPLSGSPRGLVQTQ